MASRDKAGYRKLAGLLYMSGEKISECPKAEEVATLSAQMAAIAKSIEELKLEIRRNTEARIYEDGVKAGKKEGISKFVGIAVTAVNVVARIVSAGIVLGVLIAAGNTVGAIDLIVKVFSTK